MATASFLYALKKNDKCLGMVRFYGLHGTIQISPILISQASPASFPPGEAMAFPRQCVKQQFTALLTEPDKHDAKNTEKCGFPLDESARTRYDKRNFYKALMGRVSLPMPSREPRLVERGTDTQAEHGPGAAQATGSLRRERPLSRRSMLVLPEAVSVREL